MDKSNELLRMERDLNANPELREKLDEEIRRIAGTGEVQSVAEITVKAAAALGYAVAAGELERAAADLEKLSDDELDAAAGGLFDDCSSVFVCSEHFLLVKRPGTKRNRRVIG